MARAPQERPASDQSATEAGTSPATASRRRQVGSASARSTLLTILGEFVLPGHQPVWTAALIDALGAMGIEEKSARQALTRTSSEGILESERSGRRVLWSLTESGRTLLEEGTERIYGFMRSDRPWDGRWLVVSAPISEAQRRLRHRLRTQLTWLGLGSPTPGLWISPDTSHAAEVNNVIRSLGIEDQAFAWTGSAAGIGEEARLLGDAWQLDEVEGRYLEFLDAFETRTAESHLEAFVAQVELIEAWRRFPFLDPALPTELLDHDWPGPRAALAFHDRHARWNRGARAAWEAFTKDAGPLP